MSEQSGGSMLFGCVAQVLLSGWFWVLAGFVVLMVLIGTSVDLDTPAVEAPTPAPIIVGGYDLTDTSINRDSACCGAVVAPVLLALVFAFKW